MLKVTTWSPDTCKCVIEYSWDSDNPQAEVQPHGIVKACSEHQGNDVTTHHNKILGENRGKNKAIKKLTDALPELLKKDDQGNDVPNLENISFSFDSNRKLKLTVKNLSNVKTTKKTQAKNALDTEFGVGAVDIEVL